MTTIYTTDDIESVIAGGDEDSVREQALDFAYAGADPVKASLAVARILLYPFSSSDNSVIALRNETDTAYERWMDEFQRKGENRKAMMAGRWAMIQGVSGRPEIGLYPIFLFNSDYGKSRRIFNEFLTYEKKPPPYLDLVWMNLFHEALGLSHTEIRTLCNGPFLEIARHMHTLLSEHNDLIETWLENKRKNLRFYGGETNTIIGLYDEILADEGAGIRHFNKNAAKRYDLGGGFNTSEIERLFGTSFVSADVRSPHIEEHDPDIIIQEVLSGKKLTIADTDMHDAYLRRQTQVEYLKFDVLEDSFPEDADSYAIVSAGFMTSTVRPKIGRELRKNGNGHILLSLHAILRVMELAVRGKEVDLFTIQRASSRHYRYKTCLLQWRKGKMVRCVTTDDKEKKMWSQDRLSTIYRSISPENEVFRPYLSTALHNNPQDKK